MLTLSVHAPVVPAILGEVATSAVRAVAPQPVDRSGGGIHWREPSGKYRAERLEDIRPPYAVGDVVLLREPFCFVYDAEGSHVSTMTPHGPIGLRYRAAVSDQRSPFDATTSDWISPDDLPEWGVRCRLRITAVRMQRLHDVSGKDMVEMGWAPAGGAGPKGIAAGLVGLARFARAWDAEHQWKLLWRYNPYIWRVQFRLVERREIAAIHLPTVSPNGLGEQVA